MKTHYLLLFLFLLFLSKKTAYSRENDWEGFNTDSVVSSLDGYVDRFHYYRSTSLTLKPLVVSIHQWSTDYRHFHNSMAKETRSKNWNFIFPDIRGANNHPKACGSEYVISDIDEVISWAVKYLPVDTSRIYIIGASGGGFNALCHLMKSKRPACVYSVWVPITDLCRWYYESQTRNPKYAADIMKCICEGKDSFSPGVAKKRSPLYWDTPAERLQNVRIYLHAGIHDGYTGAVPIIHTLAFYNKLLKDMGAPENYLVPPEDIEWMLTTRTSPEEGSGKISGRKKLYYRRYGGISLTLFEGGHEILVNDILVSETL